MMGVEAGWGLVDGVGSWCCPDGERWRGAAPTLPSRPPVTGPVGPCRRFRRARGTAYGDAPREFQGCPMTGVEYFDPTRCRCVGGEPDDASVIPTITVRTARLAGYWRLRAMAKSGLSMGQPIRARPSRHEHKPSPSRRLLPRRNETLARVPVCPNADIVTPRLDGHLDRVVPVDRPDATAVDQDVERTSRSSTPTPCRVSSRVAATFCLHSVCEPLWLCQLPDHEGP